MSRDHSRDHHDERSPLLSQETERQENEAQVIDFEKDDPENPRLWSRKRKAANVGVIALMAVLSPLASSMFNPGINEIALDLGVEIEAVVAATTGYVILLGLGPLILAPLSETFGRRNLYLICFGLFAVLQIPTALSPNVETLVAMRTITGFFASVGIANGAGTLNDMYVPQERSTIFGWYLLGPLLGPSLGPLFGGFIIDTLGWRWVFWIMAIVGFVNTFAAFIFLRESYAPVILTKRCQKFSEEYGGTFTFPKEDTRGLLRKTRSTMARPFILLGTQPVITSLAVYQAVVFSTMYSLFTNMDSIFGSPPYNFDTTCVGLTYLAPGLGFLTAVWFIVPRIDTVYNYLTEKHGEAKPEYRLPLANLGGVLVPIALIWFAWTVEFRVHWAACLVAAYFFGLGQVSLFNSVQNYYIDAFSNSAASAVAAGAAFRAVIGGIIPLLAPGLFDSLGYGWGWTVFALVSLALLPMIPFFQIYGESIRLKYAKYVERFNI